MPLNFQCTGGLLSSEEISQHRDRVIRVTDQQLLDGYSAQSRNYQKRYLAQQKAYRQNQSADMVLPSKPVKYNLSKLDPQVNLFPNGWALGFDDIEQKGLGECFFDAAAMSIASYNPRAILANMYDAGDTVFVKFYGKSRDDVYIYQIDKSVLEGNLLFLSYNFNQHQPWAAILEKAYAIHRQHLLKEQTQSLEMGQLDMPVTSFLNGGNSHMVYQSILGDGSAVAINPYDAIDPEKPSFMLYAVKLFNEHISKNSEQIELEKEKISMLERSEFDLEEHCVLAENVVHAFNLILNNLTMTNQKFYEAVMEINQFIATYNVMIGLDKGDASTEKEVKKYENTMSLIMSAVPKALEIVQQIEPVMPANGRVVADDFKYDRDKKEPFQSKEYTSKLGEDLQHRMNQGEILAVATKPNFGKPKGWVHSESRESGMVSRHAYHVVGVQDVSSGKQLKVANPWLTEAGDYNQEGTMQLRDRSSPIHKRAFEQINAKQDGKKLRNTINYGTLTTDYVQAKDSDYSGVTAVRESDIGRYFDTVYFAKPENALVLLNAIQNLIQCTVLRLGIENPQIAGSVRQIWDILQQRQQSDITLAEVNKVLATILEVPLEAKSAGDDMILRIANAVKQGTFEAQMAHIAKANAHLQITYPEVGVLEAIDQFINQFKAAGLDLPRTQTMLLTLEVSLENHDYFNVQDPKSRKFYYELLDKLYQNLHDDVKTNQDPRAFDLLEDLLLLRSKMTEYENSHYHYESYEKDPQVVAIEADAEKVKDQRQHKMKRMGRIIDKADLEELKGQQEKDDREIEMPQASSPPAIFEGPLPEPLTQLDVMKATAPPPLWQKEEAAEMAEKPKSALEKDT
ncbi:hypothetical protein L3V82_00435 [Thiotrichales bacterium 19S3-7]|nr:hypothetical protein [Thiotrichales bacterium 19S3-7]MCF6800630.1 hypothetical protein [Thiotrichales bacterium 19S3-11]